MTCIRCGRDSNLGSSPCDKTHNIGECKELQGRTTCSRCFTYVRPA